MFASYREVLAAVPTFRSRTGPGPGPLRRGIELDDVWFRYGPDQPWVLRGVTCFLPHGQAVALVGHNGAGKSTLVKLLCRFYDPDRGRIRWDGTDLRDMDPAALRQRVSVVFQDYMAYELSAADNIAVGDLDPGRGRHALQAAARRAGIHDVLAGLPEGYRTLLTRTYFDLADKENPRDRRAAVRRPVAASGPGPGVPARRPGPDDPGRAEAPAWTPRPSLRCTAARPHRRDQTTVLISHRLNAIRDADHILVLSGGVITEQGDHDDLMALSGTYARLFSLQARGYIAGSDPG